MTRLPLIGVTGPAQRGRTLRRLTHFAVRRAGGWPVSITPGQPFDLDRLAGLVIAGGADIDPGLYGQPNLYAKRIDPARDRLEADLLQWAIRVRKPVLAICRGMQLLTVMHGGSLHQEASSIYPEFRPTRGFYGKIMRRRPVQLIKDGWLSTLLKMKSLMVNSLHHQTVAEIGSELEAVAIDDHGMVQAVETVRKDSFVVGLQWHPELMPYSKTQMSFFRALVAEGRRASS